MKNPSASLQCPPITKLEAQAVAIATGYAGWLVAGQPFGNFELFRLARVLDEWIWCAILLLGVAMYFAGFALWRCRVRALGLIIIGLVWLLMAVLILAADVRLPGIWMLAVLGISAIAEATRLIR